MLCYLLEINLLMNDATLRKLNVIFHTKDYSFIHNSNYS